MKRGRCGSRHLACAARKTARNLTVVFMCLSPPPYFASACVCFDVAFDDTLCTDLEEKCKSRGALFEKKKKHFHKPPYSWVLTKVHDHNTEIEIASSRSAVYVYRQVANVSRSLVSAARTECDCDGRCGRGGPRRLAPRALVNFSHRIQDSVRGGISLS